MKLNEIFKKAPEIEIESISFDSRKKMKNSLFFCIKGIKNDGHKHIKEAVSNGAVAICFSDDDIDKSLKAVYIKVNDVVKTLGRVSNIFYNYPSFNLNLVGITGTNGKTSVSIIAKELLDKDYKAGYIGTLGIIYDEIYFSQHYTTPDINSSNYYLSKMNEKSCKYCLMEVSSIGIAAKRIEGLNFKIAAYTNLTHDHLDYHGSMKEYFNAKKLFFDSLNYLSIAITNIDDEYGSEIVKDCKAKIVTYGIEKEADYQAIDLKIKANGSEFILKAKNKSYKIYTNLMARYNIYNLLCAIAIYAELGNDIERILPKLNNISQIKGRMQSVEVGQPFKVIVDFAHTPDGLTKVFEFASSIVEKGSRIVTVFGSAGRRDSLKRKMFGQIADKYADLIYLTEDDPRDESIIDIAKEIEAGISKKTSIIIEDRKEAIESAISILGKNDILLILGKGDEKFLYKEFGKEYYEGDDVVAKNYIKKLLSEVER